MANRYAVATGNWSDTATWDGGTLPTAGDVVRPNGFTVTIDVDVTVDELTNNASAPAVAGGVFIINDGVTLNASIINPFFNAAFLTYSGNGSAVINADVKILPDFNSAKRTNILVNGTGELTINGDIIPSAEPLSIRHSFAVYVTGAATLNFNGYVTGQPTTGTNPAAGILVENNAAIVNVVGVVEGANEYAIWLNSNCRLTVNGSVIAGTLSYNSRAIEANANAEIVINGYVEGNNTAHAVFSPASTNIFVSGQVVNNGLNAVYSRLLKVDAVNDTQMDFKTNDINVDKSMYTAGLLTGYPLPAKVENGTVFGPSSEFTGTLLPWSPAFAQALANAQRDLQLPQILSAITQP